MINKRNLKNVVWKEGESYVSWNINTDVSSFGDTKKEALEMLEEALELYFEDTLLPELKESRREIKSGKGKVLKSLKDLE